MTNVAIPEVAWDADTWTRVEYVREGSHHWETGTLVSYSNHPLEDPPPPTTPKLERAKQYLKEAEQLLREAQVLYQESPDVDVKDPDTNLTPEEAALIRVHDAKNEVDQHIARVRELTAHIPIEESDEPEGPTSPVHIFNVDPDQEGEDRVTVTIYPPKRVEEAIRLAP